MSPERHVHRLPGQRPKLERRIFPVGFVPSTMEQMHAVIIEQFRDNPEMLTFYRENRSFYRSFFNARLDISQKKGSERFNRFVSKYATEDSKYYKEERFTVGRPILDRINASLFPGKAVGRR